MKTKGNPFQHLVTLGFSLLVVVQPHAAMIVWTNTTGGNWNVAANWEPNQVPGVADTAIITNRGTYAVTLNVSPTLAGLMLGGTSGAQILVINGYTLTLNGSSTAGSSAIVNFDTGTIAGTGELRIDGVLNWSGGTISSVGGVTANGSLLLSGANYKYVRGGVLRNAGAAQWTQGSFYVDGGGVLSNQLGATFDMTFDGTLAQGSGAGSVQNAGLWRKSGGTNAATLADPFVNSGTLEVQSGTLVCNAVLNQSGTVTVASNAVLRLAGGGIAIGTFETAAGGLVDITSTYNLHGGAQLNGDGLYQANAGWLMVNGAVPVRNLDLLATLDGTNTLTVTGVMNWKAGTMQGGGRTVIETGGTLNLVNAGAVTAYPRTIENGGTVICTGTGDLKCGSAMLTNRSTGIWDLRSNQGLGGVGGGFSPRFENAGTFRKSQGTGTNTIFTLVNYPGGRVEVQSGGLQCNAAFDQGGTVNVSGGAGLRLVGSGTITGLFDTAAGGLVDWAGSYTLNLGAQLNGDGLYQVSGGDLTVNGAVPVRNLDLLATLDGTNTLTVTGVMNWKAGTMQGGGRTVIEAGATLNLANAAAVTAYPRTIENGGTVICTGTGDLKCGSAVLTNRSTGIWDLRNNQALGGVGGGFSPRFENAGTFRKSQGTGTNTIFTLVNYPGGRVEVQSGGLQCNAAFNQGGTVILSVGTVLRLASGGTATGLFDTAAGGLVDWTGVYALNPGAQLNGDGLYQISSGAVAVNGAVPVRNLDLLATLDGTNTLTVKGVMNWKAGTMQGGGRTVIEAGAMLNLVNAGAVTAYPRTIESGGTVICTGTGDLKCGSAVLTNRSTGIWELRSNQALGGVGGGFNPRFDNAGIFRKSQGTGTNTLFDFDNHPGGRVEVQSGGLQCNAAFNQGGTVNVSGGGALRLAGGGTATGAFETGAGGLVDWTGSYTLNPGAQLNGDGLYQVSGGNFAVDGAVPVSNLDLLATLDGTNTLTITGVMNWKAGTMQGGGRTVIAPGAMLNLANAAAITAYPRTIENGGTVICTGTGDLKCGSAVLTNRSTGIWDLRSNQALGGVGGGFNPRFDNAGIFRKSQGTGTSTVFSFFNYGRGTVSVWQGAINFSGGLNLSGAGTLEFGLAGTDHPAGYGRIVTSQPLQVFGCLVVTFRNGYLPGPAQYYDIISAPISGTFQSYSAPPISPHVFINPVYQPSLVQLVTTDPTPTLSKPRLDAQKRFTMEVSGIASQFYVVATSTNFVDWTPLQTNSVPASTVWRFVDEDSASLPWRFYRAEFLP